MNILFYLARFPAYGGIETVTATLANAFVKQSHKVVILSHYGEANKCVSLKLDSSVRCLHMPDARCVCTNRTRECIENVVSNYLIDVVVFQDSYAPIEHNLDGLWGKVPVVSCEHSMPYSYREINLPPHRRLLHYARHPITSFDPYRQDAFRKRYIYDRCWRYLLLSTQYFGEFKALTRLFDSRKLVAMPNPLESLDGGDNTCWSSKEDAMVFSATLSSGKGLIRALSAFVALRQFNSDFIKWKIYVLGDGPERDQCEAFIQSNNLNNVFLEGYKDNVFKFLMRAKIYLSPSSRDGFPMSLVEAMSCGCVPVAFNSFGAVYDIINNGVNGCIVPAFDVDAYAKTLSMLMSNDGLMKSMSSKATLVQKIFATDEIVKKWDALLSELRGGR